jgi:hypothetical protein
VLVAGMLGVAASRDLWEWERWVVERRCFGSVARRGIGDLQIAEVQVGRIVMVGHLRLEGLENSLLVLVARVDQRTHAAHMKGLWVGLGLLLLLPSEDLQLHLLEEVSSLCA